MMVVSFFTKGKGKNAKHIPITNKKGISKKSFNENPAKTESNFRIPTLPNDPPKFTDKKFISTLKEPVPSSSQFQSIIDEEFKKTKFAQSPMIELQAEKEAFEKGFERGTAFMEGTVKSVGDVPRGTRTKDLDIFVEDFEVKTIDTKEDLEDVLMNSAFDAEQNDRQSSDFSLLAREIEDLQFGDTQDEEQNDAWDAFEEGIKQGIFYGLSQTEVLKVDR